MSGRLGEGEFRFRFADFRHLIMEVRAAAEERRLVEVIDLLLLRSAYERYVKEVGPEGEERDGACWDESRR